MENEEYDPQLHLSFSNMTVDKAESPKVISLNIKCSKTDQGAVGMQVILDDICSASVLIFIKKREFSWGFISVGQQSLPFREKACRSCVPGLYHCQSPSQTLLWP